MDPTMYLIMLLRIDYAIARGQIQTALRMAAVAFQHAELGAQYVYAQRYARTIGMAKALKEKCREGIAIIERQQERVRCAYFAGQMNAQFAGGFYYVGQDMPPCAPPVDLQPVRRIAT